MSKLTILCVANWDSDVGYAWWLMESFWVKIAENYQNNFNVLLAYPSISKIPNSIQESPLKIKTIDFTFNLWYSIFPQLIFIVRNRVKHIYFSDRTNTSWRYFFYRLAGIKNIIVHDHTPGLRTRPGFMKYIIKSILTRVPLLNSTGSIGTTEFVRQRLIFTSCIPEKRCFSAPNGIPLLENSLAVVPNIHKMFNIPKERAIIVSVGRVNLYKGVYFALEVIKELVLHKRINNVHFLYIGGGPDINKCKNLALELGIADFVCFSGRVSNIEHILPSCQVAFHPSKGEVGYSLAILEYMRAGLPVVVPDNPSVCGATEHGATGMIYKEGDIIDANINLLNLIQNHELSKMIGLKGKLKIKELYSLEKCHEKLIAILLVIIKK
jgi:glycosyltransferase involved in cell wall biosynthesis